MRRSPVLAITCAVLTLGAALPAQAEELNRFGDLVWLDLDRDGRQGADEPPAPGVGVRALTESGAELARTLTGADGRYLFADLPDGSYWACFELDSLPAAVADYRLTTPDAGSDTADSDADPRTGCTGPRALDEVNRSDDSLDAGLVAPLNQVGDRIWLDADADGVQGADEPGVPDVRVSVFALGIAVSSGPDGSYRLSGLPDGAHTLCFDLAHLPEMVAGYRATEPGRGEGTEDSDVNPETGCAAAVGTGLGQRENHAVDLGLAARH